MSGATRRVRVRVRGRVQGVGFRWATERQAIGLGIRGGVRNAEDGSVEIVAEGASAAIDSLLDWCHRGPATARVARVEVVDDDCREPLRGFETWR